MVTVTLMMSSEQLDSWRPFRVTDFFMGRAGSHGARQQPGLLGWIARRFMVGELRRDTQSATRQLVAHLSAARGEAT